MNLINLYDNLYYIYIYIYIYIIYIAACRVNTDAIRPCGKTGCNLCEVGAVEKYWPIMNTKRGQCAILPKNSTAKELVTFECVPCKVLHQGNKISNVFHHVETRTHYEVAS